jgi:hypothetical protein
MKWENGKIKLCQTTTLAELIETGSYDAISQVFEALEITKLYNGNYPFIPLPFPAHTHIR